MVHSMTGFGRAEYADADRKITVEIKSVNHRYLDLGVKMPRSITRFEPEIRNVLKDYMERGKVDCYINYTNLKSTGAVVKYDSDVARQYVDHLLNMKEDLGLYEELKPSMIARFPDVFTVDENYDIDDDEYIFIEKVVREAGERFAEARAKEGANLTRDLLAKVDEIETIVGKIEEFQPQIIENYKAKLHQKVEDLLGNANIDENRLIEEVTIYADRVAIDEEMVRLKSHVKAVRDMLQSGAAIGRKLDFIIQEMNREANTTLSKSDTLSVTDFGIDLKTCIEKVREQVQNLE